MNTDNVLIEAAVNGLEQATDIATTTGTTGTQTTLNDIWDRTGLIGASAYQVTCATSQTLSVTSGSTWNLGTVKRGRTTTDVILNFGAKTSGVYAIIADGNGGLTISALSAIVPGSATVIYSVQYNAPDFESAARLVPILLHGDDYARMLSSVLYGSFTRVADRLSQIEQGGTGLGGLYGHLSITSALWQYGAGHFRNNNLIVSTAASTLPLEASATHYVEVALSTGTVSYTTTGWTASEAIALRRISTVSGLISGNQDARTWAIAGAGGAGGTAGLENSGTTDGLWQLYRGTGATSAPVSTAVLAVDRGSQTDTAIRWNETADVWQFTNDGTTYHNLLGPGTLDLGGGQVPRFNIVASAPAILTELGLSTSGTATLISLSAYTSTTTTMAVIRATAFDSALSTLFVSTEPFPGVAFYRDSGTVPPDVAAKIVADWQEGRPQVPQMVMLHVASQTIQYVTWAASDASLRVSAHLVGFIDTIQGVGTTLLSATVTGLSSPISTGDHVLSFGQFSGAANRVQVFYLETSGTLGAGSLYDVEFYSSEGGTTSQLLFQARGIDASAPYVTRLPWVYRDLRSTTNVYLRLSHQAASAGTFSLTWHGERFANFLLPFLKVGVGILGIWSLFA